MEKFLAQKKKPRAQRIVLDIAEECTDELAPDVVAASKTTYEETQTHGFEVDLVGARAVRDIADTRAKTTPRDDDSRNGSSSCV